MAIVGLMSTESRVSIFPGHLPRIHHTVFILDRIREQPWGKVAPWVHGHNLLLVTPLGEWANVRGWLGIGEIRPEQIGSVSGHRSSVCSEP